MKLTRIAIAAGCLLAAAASAVDEPAGVVATSETPSVFRFSSTDHMILSNAKDPDDAASSPTDVLMHENTLRGDFSDYSLGVNFSNRWTTDGPRDSVRAFVLEKKVVTGEWESWRVDVGDSHQELGRGIALSLYRDPVFGIDNTVEGGSVRYHPSGLDVNGFVGRVNALKAPVAINPVANPIDGRQVLIAGASVKGRVTSDTQVGAHYVFTSQMPLDWRLFDKKQWHTGGATLGVDNVLEGVDLYLESNLLVTSLPDAPATSLPNGYGSYGSLTWSPHPWKARIEVKDYRDYFYDFRRPPTLEEDIVLAINTQNVSAGKLYVEHQFQDSKTTVYGSYLIGDERVDHATLHHGVLGTKFAGPGRSAFEVKSGYRTEPGKMYLAHGAVKSKLHTFKGQAVELEVRKQYTKSDSDSALVKSEDRNSVFFTYTFSEMFNAGLGYEYIPTNPDSAGKNFFNVGGTYKWGQLTAKAFIGETSGGVLCSGGVCRQVPPYTGAMVETTYVF